VSKLLIVGDLHLRGDNPRNRKGNYYQDCLAKLEEVFDIAQRHGAMIVQVGDVFNSPATSISVVSDFAYFLQWHERRIHTVPGNHDIFAHNIETLPRTPLGLLLRLNVMAKASCNMEDFDLRMVPFDHTLDHDGHEYVDIDFSDIDFPKILVVHGMLLPRSPGFEMRHTLIDDVAKTTNADVIISGHYHQPFMQRTNGKLFINPGALMRISATHEEIERTPQVVLLDTKRVMNPGYMPLAIPLDCARPGEEVLDRTQLETEETREENMRQFVELLEQQGESKYLNIQAIMESIAEASYLPIEVVEEALARIAKVREQKKEEI